MYITINKNKINYFSYNTETLKVMHRILQKYIYILTEL